LFQFLSIKNNKFPKTPFVKKFRLAIGCLCLKYQLRRFFSDRTRGLNREHVFGLEYTAALYKVFVIFYYQKSKILKNTFCKKVSIGY